jgi:hypothetical protein
VLAKLHRALEKNPQASVAYVNINGDALYPFAHELAPPHKKLLTIYIDKQIKSGHKGTN